jgi:hypothetical protein
MVARSRSRALIGRGDPSSRRFGNSADCSRTSHGAPRPASSVPSAASLRAAAVHRKPVCCELRCVATPVRGVVDRHARAADHTARTPPFGLRQSGVKPVKAANAHQEEDTLKSPIGRCRFARLRAPPIDFFGVDEHKIALQSRN